jgi:hypothetical protein
MTNQRRVPNSPKKDDKPGESQKGKGAESGGTSPLLVMTVGFVLLIGYTIWSSIQTYGNALHSDME